MYLKKPVHNFILQFKYFLLNCVSSSSSLHTYLKDFCPCSLHKPIIWDDEWMVINICLLFFYILCIFLFNFSVWSSRSNKLHLYTTPVEYTLNAFRCCVFSQTVSSWSKYPLLFTLEKYVLGKNSRKTEFNLRNTYNGQQATSKIIIKYFVYIKNFANL